MQWNADQEKAINTCWLDEERTSRCNVLVNAAAGSGKTAVLVERIIRKIMPDAQGRFEDIDRLLVVTFTKAAAAEMKQRINNRMIEAMEQAGDNRDLYRHLKRQQQLLSGADISNIDSFCMRVMRNHFHVIGVDPSVSPTTQAQAALLEEQAMTELFSEFYERSDEDAERFCAFAEKYSSDYSDRVLSDIILSIYHFVMSLPEPKKWLDEQTDSFGKGELSQSDWVRILREDTEADMDTLSAAIASIRTVIIHIIAMSFHVTFGEAEDLFDKIMETDDVPSRYWGSAWSAIRYDYEGLCRLRDGEAEAFKWSRFPTSSDRVKGIALEHTDQAIDRFDLAFSRIRLMREEAKEIYKSGQAYAMDLDAEQVKIAALREDMELLCALTKKFIDRMDEIKAERNVLEFGDIERDVYRLLHDHEEIRASYREKYREILIDEYQDINALQEAIFNELSDGTNLFMVGDMKQSIYRFRNADPTIFKYKLDTYRDKQNQVIGLNRNYRSREQTLESINEVFETVMSEEIGEITYDDKQRLYAGDLMYADINGAVTGANRAEAYLITTPPDETTMKDAEKEARFIADKIAELKRSGFQVRCSDGQGGYTYRPLQNRDIAILRRSVKNVAQYYEDALREKNIDCYVETSGYFDRPEIKIALSLVKTIDNPLCDIPLIALLRSYIFGFSDNELAQIRMAGGGTFYDCVVAALHMDGALSQKCAYFLSELERWRGYAKYMPSDRLLWTLYEETDFYALAGTWTDGRQAQANLRLLFEHAKEYEDTGFRGLFYFIRYIDKLSEYEGDDLSPAKLISEEHDVVRIMTMHKSKGLEFPVVFLTGMCSAFQMREGRVALHRKYGMGLSYINEDRCIAPNITYDAVKKKNVHEELSESMRVLYVAMTRAKEKLFVVGATKSEAMTHESHWDLMYTDNRRRVRDAAKAKCFMDWIAPVARRSNLWLYHAVQYNNDGEPMQAATATKSTVSTPEPESVLSYMYPFDAYTHMPPKVTVTQIKQSQYNDADSGQMITFGGRTAAEEPIKKPRFLSEKKLSGAELGTAAHYVLQTLDDHAETINEAYVRAHIDALVHKGALTQTAAEQLRADKIALFYETELGKRVRASSAVYKECPFEILADVSEIFPDAPSGEKILVQGIIDCYFIEDDGQVVLIDYKTDAYEKTEEGMARMREKYETQLAWYARAIEAITKKCVKEKYLYLFSGNDVV